MTHGRPTDHVHAIDQYHKLIRDPWEGTGQPMRDQSMGQHT